MVQVMSKPWQKIGADCFGTVDRQRIICRAVYTHVVFIRLQLFRRHFQPTRTMECTKIRAVRLFSCQKLIALLFSFVFLFRCRWLRRCLNSHNKIGTKRVMTAKITTVRFQIDVFEHLLWPRVVTLKTSTRQFDPLPPCWRSFLKS